MSSAVLVCVPAGLGRSSCKLVKPSSLPRVTARAALEGAGAPRQRLVDVLRLVPGAATKYFESPWRRALFGGISLLGGFFVAQTISLSFGAVGVNDVIASALCVRFYFTRRRPSLAVALLNNFKMGFTYGLFIDAFKLAS